MCCELQRCPAQSCFRHVQDDHELGAEHDGQGDPGPPVTRTVPVNPVDPSGIVSPMRSMRRRQDASMVVWSCDSAAATVRIGAGPSGALSTGAAEAGLRWLTDRWPGGTIGNEPEVYSG